MPKKATRNKARKKAAPNARPARVDGWDLAPDEWEPFLDFLFGDIARKPAPVKPTEATRVARRLRWLAAMGTPVEISGEETEGPAELDDAARTALKLLAKRILDVAMQIAEFPPATKTAARRFLKRHARTYLVHDNVAEALELLEAYEIPTDAAETLRPPVLTSATFTDAGPTDSRRQDDTTERIYVASRALQRAGARKIRPLIERKLNEHAVDRKRGRGEGWTYAQVNDRINQFTREQGGPSGRRKATPRKSEGKVSFGEMRTNFWLGAFRREQEFLRRRNVGESS